MIEIKDCPICGSKHHKIYLSAKDYFLTGEDFTLKQCSGCDFIFISPRPDDDDLSRYYQSDKYLSHHAKGFSPLKLAYQLLRTRNIRGKFNLVNQYSQQGSILDVGCGTGELLSYFKKQGWKSFGVEPDVSARNFAVMNLGLEVFDEGQISKFDHEFFDVVSMWHVLEHVPDINGRILEIYQILKRGGFFFVALPNYLSWDANHYREYWAAWDVPRHLYHFSKQNIIQLTEKQDFKFVKSVPMIWDSTYISLMSERYKGNKFPYFKAIRNGIKSNRMGHANSNYSSMIYIFRKN